MSSPLEISDTIHEHELIPLLVGCIPEFRARLVASVDYWLHVDGTCLIYIQLFELTSLVVERFSDGNYERSTELFQLVEKLLTHGSQSVRNAIATGFLESLQNQTTLSGEYWAPLLGKNARKFCAATDEFYGVKTPGLKATDDDL
jgi:hypothetical protein